MQKEPNYENAAKDKKTGKSHRPCVPFLRSFAVLLIHLLECLSPSFIS